MKNLLLLLLLVCVFSCKEKLAPIPAEIGLSGIFQELKFAGVSDNNIKLEQGRIIVHLPANYLYGNVLKPYIKLREGFSFSDEVNKEMQYQGSLLGISVTGKASGSYNYFLIVIPETPLASPAQAAGYEVTIQPEAEISFSLDNIGTVLTINDKKENESTAKITFVKEGSKEMFETFSGDISSDTNGKGRVNVRVPLNMTAGEYRTTIEWGTRKVEVPVPVTVKYGSPKILSYGISTETPFLKAEGINLDPGNTYELKVENDFFAPIMIKLTQKDYNNLEAALPKDFPYGNYKSTWYINGKEVIRPDFQPYYPYTSLNYKKSASQPVLRYVSQPSLLVTGVCYYYVQTTTVSRTEPIVADISFPLDRNDKAPSAILRLTNIETGKVYDLKNNGPAFSALCMYNILYDFDITSAVPNGRYKVAGIIGEGDSVNASSELLGQIITIK